jgi:hypothetical protein
MHPAIRAIPTFGTCSGCYHGWAGYKPARRKYSSQSGDKDDRDGWDDPDPGMLGAEED